MKIRFMPLLCVSLLTVVIASGCIVVDLNGCSKETVRGSGEVVTEERQVADFNTIKLKGTGGRWTCCRYDDSSSACRDYEHRPLECRCVIPERALRLRIARTSHELDTR